MTFMAKRLAAIDPSPTISITARANEMRSAGKDVIGLSAGEPDFDTPEHIKRAAKAALDADLTKYTTVDGMPALKRAIIRKFKRDNALNYNKDQISVGTGAKQVLFNALMATLNPSDEVIIPAPYWVSYPDMVVFAGGTPVMVACSAKNDFKLQAEALNSAITDRTKWIIFNNPCNPTGAAYSYAELKALTDVLVRHPTIFVLSDDIYEYILYDGYQFVTPAQVEPQLFHRTLIVNGVSKTYAMTGFRIGYGAGPLKLINAMAKIQSQSTSSPCSIAQAAALEALDGPQDFLASRNAIYQRRRDMVIARINKIDGLYCNIPQGAFYLFCDCKAIIGSKTMRGDRLENDTAVVSYLLETARVAVVPGNAFGLEGFFRISYAADDQALTTALDRIENALAQLR